MCSKSCIVYCSIRYQWFTAGGNRKDFNIYLYSVAFFSPRLYAFNEPFSIVIYIYGFFNAFFFFCFYILFIIFIGKEFFFLNKFYFVSMYDLYTFESMSRIKFTYL